MVLVSALSVWRGRCAWIIPAAVKAMSNQRKFILSDRCTRACSLHPDNLDFDTLTWYNDRRGEAFIIAESDRLGRKLSAGSISRHRKHLDYEDENAPEDDGKPVDHLTVLQKMISQGAKRSEQWRIGPAETLKAMEMYYRLTQGSAMASLLEGLTAVAAGSTDEEVEMGSFDAGSLSPAETESVGADSD